MFYFREGLTCANHLYTLTCDSYITKNCFQFILALGENHIYLWLVIRIVYALQTRLVSHSL